MRWSARSNKNVVEAVVAAFREPAESSARRLSALSARAWERSYLWLDAGGMALYFLDRVESLHIESALPAATLARLRGNLADNRDRSSTMLAEFAALNRSFQDAGVVYANLKGFTLSPDSCPRPELRCQLDHDFLIDGAQLDLCRKLLSNRGYELTAATPDVWEFKAGASELVSIKDHYKSRPQLCVELHFASSEAFPHLPFRDLRLDRITDRLWRGLGFPALAPADLFIAQAMHLFKHLCSACTRLSWLLEYQHHVAARYEDQPFWEEVRRYATHPHASMAIGLATLLASRIFGCEAPPQLKEWTTDRLPAAVRLWADRYGRESILADFPGTKLYLLLQDELKSNESGRQQTQRSRLVPLNGPPRIVRTGTNDSVWKRMRGEACQIRYVLFRLRFHVVEGLRYLVEVSRWKRQLATLRKLNPDLTVD